MSLWEQSCRETFADWQRLEREIATELAEWQAQALPLGANQANQDLLVGAVKGLLQDLQADARGALDGHLQRHAEYVRRSERLRDDDPETTPEHLERLRENALAALRQFGPLVGLEAGEFAEVESDLRELQRNPRAFLNTKELLAKTLAGVNRARERKFAGSRQAVRAWTGYDNGLGPLGGARRARGRATG